MRTKTLFLTALLGIASVASVMAQSSNVYSVNVVGYVTYSMEPGFNLVANPLDAADNSLEALITSAPDGTTIYVLRPDGSGYNIYTWFLLDPSDPSQGGIWDPAGPTLEPGQGFYLLNPDASAFSVTWVGEVKQGMLANTVPNGFSIQASQVPQQADVSTLGLQAGDTDTIYRLKAGGQGFDIFTFFLLDPSDPSQGGIWDPAPEAGPTINVGESFFLLNTGSAAFSRDFQVN